MFKFQRATFHYCHRHRSSKLCFNLINPHLEKPNSRRLNERSRRVHCKLKFIFIKCTRPDKLIRHCRDELYDPEVHHVSKKGVGALPIYQFDDLDAAWLGTVNEERECLGEDRIHEWMLEDVVEAAEEAYCIKRRTANPADESLNNLEFDEDARCDICQSVGLIFSLISSTLPPFFASMMVRMAMN